MLLCESGIPIADSSRYIEWIYVIDLDEERFHISDDSYFCLSNLPRDLKESLDASTALHKSAHRQVRPVQATETFSHTNATKVRTTTNNLPPSNGHDDGSATYFDLQPSIVVPRWSRVLDQRPITTVARHKLDAILEEHSQLFSQAQYAAQHDDFIFREAAFTILRLPGASSHHGKITPDPG
jgi:hypothetical protein